MGDRTALNAVISSNCSLFDLRNITTVQEDNSTHCSLYNTRNETNINGTDNSTCNVYFTSWITGYYIVLVNTVFTLEVIIVNIIVLYLFTKKISRTPVTVLLSAIAVADSMTAIMVCGSDFVGVHFYTHQINESADELGGYRWRPTYPSCLIVDFCECLALTFHHISVLLTTILCVQKMIAILFPFWTRIHLNNSIFIKMSALTFVIGFILYFPLLLNPFFHHTELVGTCCYSDDSTIGRILEQIEPYNYLAMDIMYVVSISIVLVCTVVICSKLTCLRIDFRVSDSKADQHKSHQSALMVVLICIIFILSELIQFFTIITETIRDSQKILPEEWNEVYYFVLKYRDVSLIVGFSLNFLIYLIMGKQLRSALYTGLKDLMGRCKCWE